MTPSRIVFVGPFGRGHLGSEAILSSQLRAFSARCPDGRFTVASFTPARHRALGLEACDLQDRAALGTAIAAADLVVVGGGEISRDDEPWNPGDIFDPAPSTLGSCAAGA